MNKVKKFGFIGPPSSRKSTLARAVSAKLKANKVDAEYVPEYATHFIREFSPIVDIGEQYFVTDKQIEFENRIKKVDCLISDSPLLLGWIYSALFYRDLEPKHKEMYYNLMNKIAKNAYYTKLFVLPPRENPDPSPARDGRTMDAETQNKVYTLSKSLCELLQIEYVEVDNSDTEASAILVTDIIMKSLGD